MAKLRDHVHALRTSLVKLALRPSDFAIAQRHEMLNAESIIGAAVWGRAIPVDEEWRFHHDYQDGHHELIFSAWKKTNPDGKVTLRYVIQPKNEIMPSAPAVLGIRKIRSHGDTIDESVLLDETNASHAEEIATVRRAFETYYKRVARELYS